MESITIPETKIPVIMHADVVVVGGGPAGFGAAVRAAQAGADTVVIERLGSLGGTSTNGLMSIGAGPPLGGLHSEILERLASAGCLCNPLERFPELASNPLFHYGGGNLVPGASVPPTTQLSAFDPDMAAFLMNDMMEENGVKVLLRSLFVGTKVDGDAIRAAVVESAAGRQAIVGRVFVDATGRGDVVAHSGAPYISAGNDMGLPIPPGLMWKMGGVDYERLFAYQKEDPRLDNLIEEARARGELPYYRPYKIQYGGQYTGHPRPDICPTLHPGEVMLWAHAEHDWGLNCAENAEDLTRAEVHIRKQIVSELKFLKKYVPGFEKAHLSGIAPFMGIREGRHPIGEYVMRHEDIRNERKFADVALRRTARDRSGDAGGSRMVTFDIPYRAFLAKKIDNLLLAGDNVSMEHEALLQIRGFGTAIRLGEVAGTAAGLCIKGDTTPKELAWSGPLS